MIRVWIKVLIRVVDCRFVWRSVLFVLFVLLVVSVLCGVLQQLKPHASDPARQGVEDASLIVQGDVDRACGRTPL